MSLYGNLPGRKDGSKDTKSPAFVPKSLTKTATQPNSILKPSRGRGGASLRGRGAGRGSTGAAPVVNVNSLVSMGAGIVDEYDPALPNQYDKIMEERARKREEAAREAEMQEQIKRVEEVKAKIEASLPSGDESALREPSLGEAAGGAEGIGAQGMGAPPAAGLEGDAGDGAAPRGMTLAQKMLEKMGWSSGEGLGKHRQGITAPLMHQKTDARSAVIVTADGHKPRGATLRGVPSRAICLRNMVAPGEVDAELAAEVAAEMSKYGAVEGVRVWEVSDCPPEEAVRVFVKFDAQPAATKALISMQDRFFAGRQIQAAYFNEDRYDDGLLAPEPGEFD